MSNLDVDPDDFDRQALGAIFDQVALAGWARLSIAAAGRDAGLPLDRLRQRFPDRLRVLTRLGRLADAATLAPPVDAGEPARDRLFDLLMRRYEAIQPFRAGIAALLRGLPFDPAGALLLAASTARSMAWLLEASGIPSSGIAGALRVKGLVVVWLAGLRTWERDESEDLTATMAAVDSALARAEQMARMFGDGRDETARGAEDVDERATAAPAELEPPDLIEEPQDEP